MSAVALFPFWNVVNLPQQFNKCVHLVNSNRRTARHQPSRVQPLGERRRGAAF